MFDDAESLRNWKGASATVSGVLKALGNERRLIILCHLAKNGEMHVGALVSTLDLSQSALSQHLARMRDEGVVESRRDGQSVLYRIADPRVTELMSTLYALYCVGTL